MEWGLDGLRRLGDSEAKDVVGCARDPELFPTSVRRGSSSGSHSSEIDLIRRQGKSEFLCNSRFGNMFQDKRKISFWKGSHNTLNCF